MISFGDSWSDNDPSRAVTNAGTDGIKRTWTSFLSEKIGVSQVNHAVAGSEAVTNSMRAVNPDASSQIASYLAINGGAAREDALYTFWAGGNDIMYAINDHLAADPVWGAITLAPSLPNIINTAANQAADQLEKLLAAGAKDIVVPNMIPYSLSPYFSSNFPAPVGVIFDGSIESNYNQVFSQRLAEMRADYPSANLYNLDWFDLVKDVAANPTDHGLDDGRTRLPAGADPEAYFWYDDLHPSSGGHEILAQYAYDEIIASLQIPEPSILVLGSVILAAGCFRRSRNSVA